MTRCTTLLGLEKEGEGREKTICGLIETELLQIRAHAISPKIGAVPLKLPPRQNEDDVHCDWEFRVED